MKITKRMENRALGATKHFEAFLARKDVDYWMNPYTGKAKVGIDLVEMLENGYKEIRPAHIAQDIGRLSELRPEFELEYREDFAWCTTLDLDYSILSRKALIVTINIYLDWIKEETQRLKDEKRRRRAA